MFPVLFNVYKYMFFTESDYSLSLKGKLISEEPYGDIISYVAALYESKTLYCTGFLVSVKHILTAATCLRNFFIKKNRPIEFYHAKIKYLVLTTWDDKYMFQQVEIHRDYNHELDDLPNNIGLITVLITSRKLIFFQNRKIGVASFLLKNNIFH